MKCDHYDYIEIVCMFKYPIVLQLVTGEEISATAIDTKLNEQRQECIKINTDAGLRLIILDTIASLKVTVNNPHFEHIQFL